MARWRAGERTMRFLVDRGRLESLGGTDLAESAGTAIERATKASPGCCRARQWRRRRRLRRHVRPVPHGRERVIVREVYARAWARPAATGRTLRSRMPSGPSSPKRSPRSRSQRPAHAPHPAFGPVLRSGGPPIEPCDAAWDIGISNDAGEATRNLLDTDPPRQSAGIGHSARRSIGRLLAVVEGLLALVEVADRDLHLAAQRRSARCAAS